jgi:hypothetical protein
MGQKNVNDMFFHAWFYKGQQLFVAYAYTNKEFTHTT